MFNLNTLGDQRPMNQPATMVMWLCFLVSIIPIVAIMVLVVSDISSKTRESRDQKIQTDSAYRFEYKAALEKDRRSHECTIALMKDGGSFTSSWSHLQRRIQNYNLRAPEGERALSLPNYSELTTPTARFSLIGQDCYSATASRR